MLLTRLTTAKNQKRQATQVPTSRRVKSRAKRPTEPMLAPQACACDRRALRQLDLLRRRMLEVGSAPCLDAISASLVLDRRPHGFANL